MPRTLSFVQNQNLRAVDKETMTAQCILSAVQNPRFGKLVVICLTVCSTLYCKPNEHAHCARNNSPFFMIDVTWSPWQGEWRIRLSNLEPSTICQRSLCAPNPLYIALMALFDSDGLAGIFPLCTPTTRVHWLPRWRESITPVVDLRSMCITYTVPFNSRWKAGSDHLSLSIKSSVL